MARTISSAKSICVPRLFLDRGECFEGRAVQPGQALRWAALRVQPYWQTIRLASFLCPPIKAIPALPAPGVGARGLQKAENGAQRREENPDTARNKQAVEVCKSGADDLHDICNPAASAL